MALVWNLVIMNAACRANHAQIGISGVTFMPSLCSKANLKVLNCSLQLRTARSAVPMLCGDLVEVSDK